MATEIFRMIEQKRGTLMMLRAWMLHKKDKTSPTVSGSMAIFKTRMAEVKRIHDYHAYGLRHETPGSESLP